MRNEKVQHIDIPFDEVGVFKCSHEQKYHQILQQTLLMTTIISLQNKQKTPKTSLYLTLKSVWIEKKQKPKHILDLSIISSIIKSQSHPEIVLATDINHSNLRIIASTEDRIWYIVSAISYVFTYKFRKELCIVTIKHGFLDYFERTFEDKAKGKDVNLDPYPKMYIKYEKPFRNTDQVFGGKITGKVLLQRQLDILSTDPTQTHQIFIARIKPQNSFQSQQEHQQDRYICHYIQKTAHHLSTLHSHKNINFITQLIYAKTTDIKIQLFFQYSRSLRGIKVIPILFTKMWLLFDKIKGLCPNCVVTTDLFGVVERTRVLGERVFREDPRDEGEEVARWAKGDWELLSRQIRYSFLQQAVQWDRFFYQHQNAKSPLHKKLYNLGLILYELCTGRHLLSYMPAFINQIQIQEQQIEIAVQLKKLITEQSKKHEKNRISIFPLFMQLNACDKLKHFINCCIFGQFDSEELIWQHEWLKGVPRPHQPPN